MRRALSEISAVPPPRGEGLGVGGALLQHGRPGALGATESIRP